jgi:diacylglycerol kinase (ATP)
LEEVDMASKVHVGILPIGTGNDLGRVLGWGFKYKNEPLEKYVKQMLNGKEAGLDRLV